MDSKEFAAKLDQIATKAWDEARTLVHAAQAAEGKDWNTDEALSFADDPTWQNKADSLAELAGWIYDRTNGRNRLHKQSMGKKIRKALGYSYP